MEKTGRHIGILKHEAVGYAEELLIKIAATRNLVASVVNPCDIAFGDDDERFPDVVLARCELSSFSGAEIWSKVISLLQSRMDKSGLGAL